MGVGVGVGESVSAGEELKLLGRNSIASGVLGAVGSTVWPALISEQTTPTVSAGASLIMALLCFGRSFALFAFVPTFLLLYVVQYLLLPLLLRGGVLAALLSDTLYAAAFTIYWYLTFLGYSELPFLRGAVYFLYPVVPVVGAYVLALLLRLNATEIVVAVYFG